MIEKSSFLMQEAAFLRLLASGPSPLLTILIRNDNNYKFFLRYKQSIWNSRFLNKFLTFVNGLRRKRRQAEERKAAVCWIGRFWIDAIGPINKFFV